MATYEKKKWEESEALKKQQQALELYKASKPKEYSSPNQQLSADALKNWQEYKPFNYNINADALYNQYKNTYMTQGKLAMQDTIGQAAALTGGYGNSYAQNVGQQAYQGYLQRLNDVVPELYQMAYNRHLQGKEDAFNNWQALQSLESQDYSRYIDTLNQYNAEYDRLYNEYNTAYDREYGQYQYDDQMAYQQYQDTIAQEQWQKQFDADQAYRNWQMSMAEKEYDLSASRAYAASNPTVATAYDNGSLSTEEVKELQAYLGIPETGYWDETSYNAAGGNTADDAYHLAFSAPDVNWRGDSDYINNYLEQTPTNRVNSYQYAQGMYDPEPITYETESLGTSYINSIKDMIESGSMTENEVRRYINDPTIPTREKDLIALYWENANR